MRRVLRPQTGTGPEVSRFASCHRKDRAYPRHGHIRAAPLPAVVAAYPQVPPAPRGHGSL